MMKRVCIIGAGPAGLSALKQCLEEGLAAVCFDKAGDIGGCWNFKNNGLPKTSVMYSSCVLNTSKAVCHFSDFPMPKHYPNYLHHSMYKKYLDSYVRHFDLLPHLRLQKVIVQAKMAQDLEDHNLTPRWDVTTRDIGTGNDETETFDCVMVCSGTYDNGFIPKFRGLDTFEGRVLHSSHYVDFRGFENKRILVVGCGNSGAEIGAELSRHAEKVFISTRHGAVVIPRASHFGLPIDNVITTRFFQYLPDVVSSTLKKFIVNLRYRQAMYDVSPNDQRFVKSLNTFSDDLCNRILVGAVTMKSNVSRFSSHDVIFEDGTREEIDAVVFATGYRVSFPFLDRAVAKVENSWIPGLYNQVWLPSGPHSLAFIGQSFRIFLGSRMPIMEMQARWAARVFAGRCKLPELADMTRAIETSKTTVRGENHESPRKVKHATYNDSVAEHIGCRPRVWRYLFTDPMLWYKLMFWPISPAQWRLDGPGAWPGARQAVTSLKDELHKPLLNRHEKKARWIADLPDTKRTFTS